MRRWCYMPVVLLMAVLAGCTPEDVPGVREVSAPTGVRLVEAGADALTFTWDEVSEASYYVGRLETQSGEPVLGGQTSTKSNTLTYTGLSANTAYSFKVSVRVGSVDSKFSAAVSAKTLGGQEPGPTPPGSSDSEHYEEFKIPAHEDAHAAVLAFPGAEGGGMYTIGGRGGKVIHVTTLADSGAGSLRAALEESGPRTIVFDVAGVIELKSTLYIKNGDVTIAGHTAPGDGICLKNYAVQVSASNVVIRFMRFRMGDEAKQENDAIWGRYNNDLVLDHCSMSWSIDECSSFYGNENFTMQWCVLTESLCNSVHSKKSHGYGGIWGGKNASFHHNLLANHKSRNPRFDHPEIYEDKVAPARRGHVDYRNNAVYNWGDNSTYGGEGAWFNMINNYYKPGPASKDRKYFIDANGVYTSSNTDYGYPYLYLLGNVHTSHQDISSDNSKGVYWHDHKTNTIPDETRLVSKMHAIYGPSGQDVYTTTHSASDAFAAICDHAGASLARDAVDERACSDARSGKATFTDGGNGSKNGIIDTQTAVGGWPEYKASEADLEKVKDTDGDGMPDWFEDQFGLDKADPADGNSKSLDKFGRYTNLEMYLHYLVRDIVEAQTGGGTYQKLS